jgi:beta-glucanase (GH16 family)
MLGNNLGSVGWPQSGEIDIMENVGRLPNTLFGTIHGPGYSGGAAIGGTRDFSAPLADGFHTYTVDWEPNSIIWYVDGSEYFRATPATLGGRQWVFDHPFFIIMNLAIGGPFPGEPDAGTPFPATLTVDYVRVSGYAPGVNNPPVTQPPATQPPGTQPPVTQPPATQPPAGGNAWAPYTSYTAGQVVTYNGVSYRVLQTHSSIPGWEPSNVAALFAAV